ncbi:MAG: hypothetical protein ABI779_19850 [Acidobacteriota bacterium]
MPRRMLLLLVLLVFVPAASAQDVCSKLPGANQPELYPWLDARCYVKLYEAKTGWARDKSIRDTGPFISAGANGLTFGLTGDLDFGVHPSVRIYYSPDVMAWLTGGRKGVVPDGGIIVKEMYYPQSAPYYNSLDAEAQARSLTSWTVMVKQAGASWDGWYWAYHAVPVTASTEDDEDLAASRLDPHARVAGRRSRADLESSVPDHDPGFPYDTDSGFGLYCLRCHASAAGEQTFISTDNIEGYAGEVITYLRVPPAPPPYVASAPPPPSPPPPPPPAQKDFLLTFDFARLNIPQASVRSFPPNVYDHVVVPQKPDLKMQFVTSDQCMGCHDATAGEQWNPAMMFTDANKKRLNYSVNGEWSASLMGLSGRDPVFHSQLESEVLRIPSLGNDNFASNFCYRCHGAMGQKQLQHDSNAKRTFPHDLVYQFSKDLDRNSHDDLRYAALARDGISCTICHHIDVQNPGTPVPPSQFTGQFLLTPSNQINGPFASPLLKSMDHTLGYTPRASNVVKTGALCGTCHSVVLPVFRRDGSPVMEHGKQKTDFEQATYPEWLNSIYQNEVGTPVYGEVRTCQDCHMPSKIDGKPISFRIANIEDSDYPFTTHRLPDAEIRLEERAPFGRHTLVGMNQFVMNMFRQFSPILGNALTDAMAPGDAEYPIDTAIDASQQLATQEAARLTVTSLRKTGELLEAGVNVANLAGHKLPSGVGFRRAFLEFQVLDANGRVLWVSGRTNATGVILGRDGKPLLTEFYDARHGNGRIPQQYQKHWQVIDSPDRVQIYEEIELDPEGFITTSFLSRDTTIKDNRLLPRGYRVDGPYHADTHAYGTEGDPDYGTGSARGADQILYRIPMTAALRGAASVKVRLHYQATPPYYLQDRFDLAANAPEGTDIKETQRLYYIGSHLDLSTTNVPNWTLEVASVSASFESFFPISSEAQLAK